MSENKDLVCREFKKLLDSGAAKLVPDYTGIAAQRYDSLQDLRADVDFYLNLAGSQCRILELGSGTGRISLPLAQAGHKVWALDNSTDMHKILKDKIVAGMNAEITQVQASMADFKINEVFDLAIMGYNTVFHLTEAEERKSCLASVRRHLRPGGRFALNARLTFSRDAKMLNGDYFFMAGEPKEGTSFFCVMRGEYDPKRQISTDNYMHVQIDPKGRAEIIITPSVEYHPSPGELRELVENAGFKIESFACDYAKTPFAKGVGKTDMMIVAVAV